MRRTYTTGLVMALLAVTTLASISEGDSSQEYTDRPLVGGDSIMAAIDANPVAQRGDSRKEIARNTQLRLRPQSLVGQSVFIQGIATGTMDVGFTPYDPERELMSLTMPPWSLH